MSHLGSEFINFISSYSSLEKKYRFGHILIAFFKERYSEITSEIVKFIYAPDCYQAYFKHEQAEHYLDILNSVTREEFSEKGEFLKVENLLIGPLSDHKNQVKYLILLESCPEDRFNAISYTVGEIKEIYRLLTSQVEAKAVSKNLKTAHLVSQIAHDINSLTALIPDEITKDDVINARIKYSEKMSREIMYYLREMKIEKSKVSFKDLLSGIISGLEFPPEVSFSEHYNDVFDSVTVDVELIDRALTDVFDNAIIATQIEGGDIDLTAGIKKNVSPFIKYDWLEIIVSDTGPGIPNEFINDIKNPFFTTWKDLGHVGLGISIADKIIQAHDGLLRFESETGQGTRAIIYLPMR
jgi:signal transduction histidine kinase